MGKKHRKGRQHASGKAADAAAAQATQPQEKLSRKEYEKDYEKLRSG